MDLIGQLAGTLGVDSGKAEGAAGAILGVIKQNAPAGALDGLVQSAPQASGWMEKAGPLLAAAGGGGGGAGALGALGGMLGGGGGGGALGALGGAMQGAAALSTITGVIEKLGIPPEIAAKAIPLVLSFVQKQLGDGGFASLVEKVPMLKELGGAGGASEGGGLGAALGGLGGLLK